MSSRVFDSDRGSGQSDTYRGTGDAVAVRVLHARCPCRSAALEVGGLAANHRDVGLGWRSVYDPSPLAAHVRGAGPGVSCSGVSKLRTGRPIALSTRALECQRSKEGLCTSSGSGTLARATWPAVQPVAQIWRATALRRGRRAKPDEASISARIGTSIHARSGDLSTRTGRDDLAHALRRRARSSRAGVRAPAAEIGGLLVVPDRSSEPSVGPERTAAIGLARAISIEHVLGIHAVPMGQSAHAGRVRASRSGSPCDRIRSSGLGTCRLPLTRSQI